MDALFRWCCDLVLDFVPRILAVLGYLVFLYIAISILGGDSLFNPWSGAP